MVTFLWGFVIGFLVGGGIGMLFAVRNKKIAKEFSDKFKELDKAATSKIKEVADKAKEEIKKKGG